MKVFDPLYLKKLYKPKKDSSGEQNGQVTIIGGSELFHGAPFLSLKTSSRIVDMVFFSSPETLIGEVANELKSKLMSFIWVPWDEIDKYIEKSDAVLIGPGLMRYTHEVGIKNEELVISQKDKSGKLTRNITKKFLLKFPNKKWVIDAGSLQTMEVDWIPENAILTPNPKELEILFNVKYQKSNIKNFGELGKQIEEKAKQYKCIIVAKGPETIVSDGKETVLVKGGNPGLTKGGTGDILAGLTAAFLAKNDPFLAASAASYIEKAAADDLHKKVGIYYNADDIGDQIPNTFFRLLKY